MTLSPTQQLRLGLVGNQLQQLMQDSLKAEVFIVFHHVSEFEVDGLIVIVKLEHNQVIYGWEYLITQDRAMALLHGDERYLNSLSHRLVETATRNLSNSIIRK